MDVRRRVAAALCVPLLALAGCSDEEPQAKPKDPTTNTRSSPSQSAPAPPSETEFTQRNAKQFVAYWIQTFNFAAQNGATEDLRLLALDSCTPCKSFADTIDQIYVSGGRIETDGWRAERFESARLAGNRKAAVQVHLQLSPQKIYRSADGDPEKTSGGEGTASFSLAWSGSSWRVANLTQQAA